MTVVLSPPRLTNGTLEFKPVTVSLGISNGPRLISVVAFDPIVTDKVTGDIAVVEEARVVVNVLLRLEREWDARDVIGWA